MCVQQRGKVLRLEEEEKFVFALRDFFLFLFRFNNGKTHALTRHERTDITSLQVTKKKKKKKLSRREIRIYQHHADLSKYKNITNAYLVM